MSGLTPAELTKCAMHKDDICGSNVIWWVVIAMLLLIILGFGGYLGYQYYTDNMCFREENTKQCAPKKA